MKTKEPALPKLQDIAQTLENSPQPIFTQARLRQIFNENRQVWQLESVTFQQFQEVLKKLSLVKDVMLNFPNRPARRYVSGAISTFELLQSLDEEAYFSHHTAIYLHKLTKKIPKTIYLNIEQPRKSGNGTLSQVGIDRAFKGKCRVSRNKATYKDKTVCLLNGANTAKLGVIRLQAPEGTSKICATNLERTLIDATVRPIYAGGASEVASAFKTAKDRVSVEKIAQYLRKLNYTYPYHQSIGFYMQHAGYKPAELALIQQFDIEYDFYLDYHMGETDYDRKWRLYVPKGF